MSCTINSAKKIIIIINNNVEFNCTKPIEIYELMISYCPKPFEDKKQVQFCHVLSPHSIISHYRTMREQKHKK